MEASHPRKRAKLDVAARVSHLFVKGLTGRSELQSVELVTERGCRGCDHENELSPRQVLLTDAAALGALGLAPGELRENLVLEGADWALGRLSSGAVVRVGDDARLRITMPCEPCSKITQHLVDARVGPAPRLKDLKAENRRGMLATVVRGGTIRVGAAVELEAAARFERIPTPWAQRVVWLLLKLPPGQVVTCGDVIKLIGEFPSMARSLPVKLRALRSEGALDASRTCRVVNADGRVAALCDGQGPQAEKARQNRELLDALEAEGVRMDAKKPTSHVDLRACRWRPTHADLYLADAAGDRSRHFSS